MDNEQLTNQIDKANSELSAGNYIIAEKLAQEVVEKSINEMGKTFTQDYNLDSHRANGMLVLATIANLRGNWDIAISYANDALALAKRYDFPKINIGMWNILGSLYRSRGYYDTALEYFVKALDLCQDQEDKSLYALVSGNIGIVHASRGTFDKALEFLSHSLSTYEQLGQKSKAGIAIGNIGSVYLEIGRTDQALEYFHKALAIREELGEKSGVAYLTGNIGLAYFNLSTYEKALEYYFKALAIQEELESNPAIALISSNIGLTYHKIGNFTKALEYYGTSLALRKALGEKSGIARNLEHIGSLYADKNFEGYDIVIAEEYLFKAIEIMEEIDAKKILYLTYKNLSNLYAFEERWKESHYYFKKYHDIKEEVQSDEMVIQAEQRAHQRQIDEREKELAIERAHAQATDKILANILPLNIVERLIKGEKKIADSHESVSVLFVDIVGFTKLSAKLPAVELIDVLDIVFSRFDTICKKYGAEKIKTIGDAYMAVCGAPILFDNHAERIALTALEMLEHVVIDQRFSVHIDLQFRIGLHSGNVVAGIIGENKYSYDVWGDAVNTASRMESHGEAGKIHVSEDFVKAVQKQTSLSNFRFVSREEMEIKGIGIMKTYFLENFKEY